MLQSLLMTARYATQEEVKNWNTRILRNPDGGNIFSTAEYAEIKKLTHYTPRFVMVGSLAVTILEKHTPPLGALWYIPKGPGIVSSEGLQSTLRALVPLARKAHVFAIRTESELPRSLEPSLVQLKMQKAAPIIPNASTITVDITPSLETILLNFPQKGRHAIRRAQRDGVTVERVASSDKNAKKMYALLSETAKGQFGIRSYTYYKAYWQVFAKAGLGQLFFASYDGRVVAGAYALSFGSKSTYKDGASVRQRPAYGASHLLQWEVIQWAKEKGATIHDLCGSPPSSEISNPAHPHYGIGLFKLSFSKHVVDYVGCYDYVVSAPRYRLWVRLFERIYRHFYYKKTRDYYY